MVKVVGVASVVASSECHNPPPSRNVGILTQDQMGKVIVTTALSHVKSLINKYSFFFLFLSPVILALWTVIIP